MFRVRKKISHKLFAALFLVAVIPICLVGYGTYRAAQNALIDTAFMHIHTVARDKADNLNTWFEERVKDIRVLSELPDITMFSCVISPTAELHGSSVAHPALLQNILALARAQSPSYDSIHVLGPAGEILASTDPGSEMLTSFKYMGDLELGKKSGAAILGPVHQHTNQKWYMHLVAPVSSDDGKAGAFVFAILDASATLDPLLANRAGLGSTGEAYLVNEEGRIVTESKYLNRLDTRERSFHTEGISAAIAQSEGTSIYTNYMGHEVVGSYLWLPKYRWGLIVEMGKGEILSPIRYIRMAIIATTGVVAFLCVLVALVMSRRISKPIIQMAEASRSIAQGRLEQRISYSGGDEIGTLSESFNAMAERLSIMIDSLRGKESSLQNAYAELIRAQAQLVQSEKMAAIGELIASVVHEMRNPLCSVKLNFQIIGRSIGKDSSLLEHYRIGVAQISQLERMFSNLMDYSKPLSLDMAPFHLKELIEGCLQQLDPLIKEMKTGIDRQNLDDVLPPVVGDADKMRQVLVNIIKNGIEAAGCEGKLEISASVAHSGERPVVTLDIIDNGPGISAQDLKRIFQPFFTTKEKGTGLGLSIVKKIIEAHQYGIAVSSEEGHGTVVSLRIQGG